MADQLDRLFDLMQEQGRALGEQGRTLAAIQQSQADTHERLFSGTGVIPYLAAEVKSHGKQLTYAKGAAGVLTVLWAGAVSFASAVFKAHH